jgi:glycosyltransferase involved in cell wall biosynthesis
VSLSNAKYSIILPVKNGGEYLRLCVESILKQTYQAFNLIVLDNNSTDGSLQWITSLDDPRVIVYTSSTSLTIEQNWGRIKDVQKNEFMTMIGHDDILKEFYLEEMDKIIGKHPAASLYQTHYAYIDKDGIVTRNCMPMDEIQKAYEFIACQMSRTIDSTGTGYMMRAKDFDELGGMPIKYPNLIFSDYELWIRLTMKSYKATSQKECFQYREHLSVSRTTNGEQYEKAFGEYVEFLSSLKKNPEFDEFIVRYGRNMLLHFCESLCHRVLKTPINRRETRVKDVVKKFNSYAKILVPGQSFVPFERKSIRYAIFFDQSSITRHVFNAINKFR